LLHFSHRSSPYLCSNWSSIVFLCRLAVVSYIHGKFRPPSRRRSSKRRSPLVSRGRRTVLLHMALCRFLSKTRTSSLARYRASLRGADAQVYHFLCVPLVWGRWYVCS